MKRKLHILIIILALSLVTIGCSDKKVSEPIDVVNAEGQTKVNEEVFFKNSKWGMSINDVKAVENLSLTTETPDLLVYHDEIFGYKALVEYRFADGNLNAGSYTIYKSPEQTERYSEKEEMEAFEEIKNELIKLYGKNNSRTKNSKDILIEYGWTNLPSTEIRLSYNSISPLSIGFTAKSEGGTNETEDVSLSYAEKHPELEQGLVEMFHLDKEYIKNLNQYFSYQEDSFFFGTLIPGGPTEEYIKFLYEVYDQDIQESFLRPVIQVGTKEPIKYINDNQLMLDGARLSFSILPNNEYKNRNIAETMKKWNARVYDVSENSRAKFKELAADFDQVLVHDGGVVSTREYILFKYIPLSEGYELEIRLRSNMGSIIDNMEEITYLLNNIIINPILLDQSLSEGKSQNTENSKATAVDANYIVKNLKPGITEEEVIKVLGRAPDVMGFDEMSAMPAWKYYYSDNPDYRFESEFFDTVDMEGLQSGELTMSLHIVWDSDKLEHFALYSKDGEYRINSEGKVKDTLFNN